MVSNIFLQLRKPRLLENIADSQNGLTNIQDKPGAIIIPENENTVKTRIHTHNDEIYKKDTGSNLKNFLLSKLEQSIKEKV